MSCFRHYLLAGLAALSAAVSAAWGAVTLHDVHVTNVGTTTFTVVWTTSELSKPGLDVYADSEGTNLLTPSLGLEYYPVAEGDPGVVNDAEARSARRSLQSLAISRRVVVVRVSGLTPATSYFVRPRTFAADGSDNGAALSPLQPVTTAGFTSFVPDSRLLRVRFPAFSAEGMVAIVRGPEGTLPVSMMVGDSTDADTALIPLANLFDMTTGTNALFTSPQPITIRVVGADAPEGTFTQLINFSDTFSVARSDVIETDLSSPAPFFTLHPSAQAGVVGESATFTAAASGDPAPSYHWQRKPVGSATWSDLVEGTTYTGVATASLVVTNLTLAMGGDAFRVRAFNGVPPDAVSDPALLTVASTPAAPVITLQPQPISVLVSHDASFTVAASGTPTPVIRWQRKPAGSGTWADLADGGSYSGTATGTLTVQAATLAMSGDQFRAVATNGVLPDATTAAATLTVTNVATAPTITTHPDPKTVSAGASASFTVAASGAPSPAFHWQRRAVGAEIWTDLVENDTYIGVTTSTLIVVATTPAMSGDRFRAVASNGTLPDATSTAATLTVLAPPVITGQPQSITLAADATATFTVAATGTGALAYQWERRAAGTEPWVPLPSGATYVDVTTAVLKVNTVRVSMSGDLFRCVVTDDIGSTTSEPASLTVSKATAAITLANLRQLYDGTPRAVSVTTVPAGLAVALTYDGSETAPVFPGVYTVSAQINDADYAGSITGQLVVTAGVLVRRAPTIAGGVDGSVHVLTAENTTLAGWISGDLLVPGQPTVAANNNPAFGGIQDGPGASQPSNYTVTIEPTAALRYLVRRIDAITLPTLTVPPAPTGTRNVSLSKATQSAGDFSTIRNLTLSGTAGPVVVPPGTYGNLTANGTGNFVLGVAGATEPAVYNLQNLSINPLRGAATLTVVGPVIINVAGTAAIYGNVGSAEHPEWLTLNVVNGSVSINLTAVVNGHVVAPTLGVTVNGASTLRGGVVADRLTVAAGAEIEQVAL
jgi:hypothetical protein